MPLFALSPESPGRSEFDAAAAPTAAVDAAGAEDGPSALLDRAAEERALGAAEPPLFPDESPP
ncbi:hypothetical protein ACFCX3_21885 [Streptomyces virginiae]|uniref:hypothetical protein n=1 Tax=Streptomyces virginiae TaxID=1961 RepID=UPI0035D85582